MSSTRRAPGGRPALWRVLVLLAIGAAAGCGKKGPPLAPFPRVPGQPDGVTAERIGDEAVVAFTVPSANADRRQPADLERVEIFAISALRAPETIEHRKLATLVATLPVRPVFPPEVLAAAADGSGPPLPPGYDQGAKATFREPLTAESRVLVDLPRPKGARARPAPPVPASDEPPFGPLVAPPPPDAGRRYYFVVAISPRGRRGQPSGVVSVPFGEASGAPGAPQVSYTATELKVTWAPPADARTATLPAVRPPKPPEPVTKPAATADTTPAAEPPATGVAPVTPAAGAAGPEAPAPSARPGAVSRQRLPAVPLPPPLLAARSRGFNVQGTTYHLYDVSPPPVDAPPAAPAGPKRLTPQPLPDPEYAIKGFTFGVERCFAVRAVDQVSGVAVQGPASPTTCVTLVDTFPPAPPQALAAIGGQGVINLIWERNSEPDLAGYLVLRGEAPGGTLQPLMTTPILETTFADRTVRPGVRYVYAVVAVDTAAVPNQSAPSNRVEDTARQ